MKNKKEKGEKEDEKQKRLVEQDNRKSRNKRSNEKT